jgi:elongation factor G
VRKDSGTAPGPRPAEQVRNVVLVGPAGAGKTTLVEALLARTGAISRAGRVEDGTTVGDSDALEVARQHSVALSVAATEHAGVKLTLLDTPGGADFVGELRAGLRAADAALFVVSAVGGMDPRTVQLWDECASVGMPRAVVVTQLDRPRADFDETVALCQRTLGEGLLPLYLPMHGDLPGQPDAVAGLIGLLSHASSTTRPARGRSGRPTPSTSRSPRACAPTCSRASSPRARTRRCSTATSRAPSSTCRP